MDFRSILMGMALVIMWSSAFTSGRMIVADAPPLQIADERHKGLSRREVSLA